MAIQKYYDHALKILARTYPESFLSLTLPNLPIQLVGTQENVELALEIDRVDFLHEIIIKGDRAYLHFDFELRHRSRFLRRVFVYNGMLTELKKPIPIISIPIYIKPREKKVPKAYEVKVGGHVFHKFTYEPIVLSDHVDRIRSGELYPLAPLLVLLTKDATEKTLVEEREIIVKHEPDPTRRRTLFTTAILAALAQKIFDPDFLWSFFKEENMLIAEDPVLNKWFNELYGVKLAEANAKATAAEEKTLKTEEALRQAEAKQREAEAKQRETEVEIKVVRREAEAKAKAEAEAARREAEAKAKAEVEVVRREAEAKAKAEVEAARREAEAEAKAKAKAEVEAARREAEAKAEAEAARREAEAKIKAAEAKAKWLETMTKFLTHRFADTPIQVVLDLQRVSDEQRLQVINLVLDAPDLATFRKQLKAKVSAVSAQ